MYSDCLLHPFYMFHLPLVLSNHVLSHLFCLITIRPGSYIPIRQSWECLVNAMHVKTIWLTYCQCISACTRNLFLTYSDCLLLRSMLQELEENCLKILEEAREKWCGRILVVDCENWSSLRTKTMDLDFFFQDHMMLFLSLW